jgi:UDP-N-acetylmuramoyl-L-alanyl-D-glutamate--2,6-diaminopimelate ligase
MAACEICAITIDSRAVVPGCMFVCIKGTRADGHAFIEEALQRGAAAVVTEREVPVMKGSGAVFVRVSNTRIALARLYDAWYGHPTKRLRLIAVTGTNGKTSVSTMLKAIFDAAMIPCGLIGTVRCVCRDRVLSIRSSDPNANMTTPDPAELYHMLSVMADEGVEVVVMEATSHALALHKLEPLTFEAAIFTNLTPEHLDFHGSMQAYFEAKASLFSRSALAILNADDAATEKLIPRCKGRVLRTSTGAHEVDYIASEVNFRGVDGVSYILKSGRACLKMASPIPGIFTLSNTLQAACCAMEMGVSARVVREAIGSLAGVDGRMERVKLGVPVDFCVFVDYAHTPDALENVIRTIEEIRRPEQQLIVLCGCGGDRDRTKRPEMAQIAVRYASLAIFTSDNPRPESPEAILDDMVAGLEPSARYLRLVDRGEAIRTAALMAKAGDILLLAGKGHETYQVIGTENHHFDDKEEIAKAFQNLHNPPRHS